LIRRLETQNRQRRSQKKGREEKREKMTEPVAPIKSHPPVSSANPAPTSQGERAPTPEEPISGPRITIQYCTQCKWMLRAAYVRPPFTYRSSYIYITMRLSPLHFMICDTIVLR
jgi:hypothetical protein